MKRDMDLVRKIMLASEAADGQPDLGKVVNEYGERAVGYHCYLIHESGLADGISVGAALEEGLGHPTVILTHLTWAGQDFIGLAQNDTIWNKAKAMSLQAAGGLTIDILKMSLLYVGKQAMAGALGIDLDA